MTDEHMPITALSTDTVPVLRLTKYILIAVIFTLLMDLLFGYLHSHFGFGNKVMAIVFPPLGAGLLGAAIFATDNRNAPTTQQAHQLALYSSGWLLAIGISLLLFALLIIFMTNPAQTNDRTLGVLLAGVGLLIKAGAVYLLYRFFCFDWAAKRMAVYEAQRAAKKCEKRL